MDAVRKLVSGRLAQGAAGPHLEPDTLASFAENRLARGDREAVLAHLAKCAECREIVFLALPQAADVQAVFRPARRSAFVFRWGTVAACVVIAAAVITTHEFRNRATLAPELPNRTTVARNTAPPAAAAPMVAAEKPPAELDAVRSLPAKEKADAAPRGYAEPKHATAKPKDALSFDSSGEVHVAEPSIRDDKSNSRALDSPSPAPSLMASDANELKANSASQQSQSAMPQSVMQQRVGYASGAPLAKQVAAGGEFSGVIVDGSGAVVPNAKVTATGSLGTTRTAKSGPDGRFSLNALPSGTYSLKAEATGFKSTEVAGLPIHGENASVLRLTLAPGAVTETVEISSTRPEETPLANYRGNVAAREQPAMIAGQAQSVAAARKKALTATPAAAVPQWTLSPSGAVQRSLDSGHTWQAIPVANKAVFQALAAVGTDVWAGGGAGLLYHSADSGQTWMRVTPSDAGLNLAADIIHIDFSDVSNGTIRTADGELWATTDSGQTWHRK